MSRVILLILSATFLTGLIGCGTQALKNHEYNEITQGKKALLQTENSQFFDMLGFMLFGEEESITITHIDGKGIKKNILNNNQHVLIEPGSHTLTARCHVNYSEKEKESKSASGEISKTFEGGNTYTVEVDFIHPLIKDKCIIKIEN